MTLAAILVPLQGGQADAAVLAAGAGLARRFDAALDVLHVEVGDLSEPQLFDESACAGFALGSLERDAAWRRDRAANARRAYDAWQADAGKRLRAVAWRNAVGEPAAEISAHGRLADLVVLPKPDLTEDGGALLDQVLFGSGRPVLAVPATPIAERPRHVAIAWNGGVTVSRAMQVALPLLRDAETVTVITIADSEAKIADPRPYLSAHGVAADWRRVAASPSAELGALRQAVTAAQPDLLVLGAGRGGWLRRLIAPRRLQALLDSSTGPVLLTA